MSSASLTTAGFRRTLRPDVGSHSMIVESRPVHRSDEHHHKLPHVHDRRRSHRLLRATTSSARSPRMTAGWTGPVLGPSPSASTCHRSCARGPHAKCSAGRSITTGPTSTLPRPARTRERPGAPMRCQATQAPSTTSRPRPRWAGSQSAATTAPAHSCCRGPDRTMSRPWARYRPAASCLPSPLGVRSGQVRSP